MKYLKRYENFINENIHLVNQNIDGGLRIVEKQVLKDFSSSFWDMSLRSSVFNDDEKIFIKENLVSIKVDLVNEGSWLGDTLGGIWNKAKEVGGKLWDTIKSKISNIKENIKNICSGISDFVKSLFKSIGQSLVNKAKATKEKAKAGVEAKAKESISKSKPEEVGSELKQLKETHNYIMEAIKFGLFGKKVESSDDNVIKDAESQVGELENELKKESINHDILSAFYITEADEANVEYKVGDKVIYKSKEGKEIEKEIIKIEGDNYFFKDKEGNEFYKMKSDIIGKAKGLGGKVWGGIAKWVIGMEQATPPQKDKAVWWIRLILRIITLILSPIVKGLELAIKLIASNFLRASSAVVNFLGGPGPYKFLILGGIAAVVPALVAEISLLSHTMPEPFGHLFEVMSHFLTEAVGIKELLKIFGVICATMTFCELVEELKHLFGGHGHGAESHGAESHGETSKVAKPGGETPGEPAVA
jgi:hypothetical protein